MAACCIIAVFIWGLWMVGVEVVLLINMTLFAMTPLTLTAVGECINEKAGLINIGLEGILLLSAIVGAFTAEIFGHWSIGLLLGTLIGALIGLLFGAISVYGKGDQIIAGLAINIFCGGFLPYLLVVVAIPGLYILPAKFQMPRISTPMGSLNPIIFVAIGIAFFAHFLIHKTILGVKIRATGEKPEATDVAGTKVDRIRILTAIIGGTLAGLAGAFMAVGWFGRVTAHIAGGRGFIALAIVMFAGREPLLALLGATIFGFVEGLSLWATISPAVKGIISPFFLKMVPYLAPIMVLVFMRRRRAPTALGKPYIRE